MNQVDPDIRKVLELCGVQNGLNEMDINLADRAIQVTTGSHGEIRHQAAAKLLMRWLGEHE